MGEGNWANNISIYLFYLIFEEWGEKGFPGCLLVKKIGSNSMEIIDCTKIKCYTSIIKILFHILKGTKNEKTTLTTSISVVIILALTIMGFSMFISPSKIYGDSYAIGDTGPAGGLIFYVDGSYYLEAAPSDQGGITYNPFSDVVDIEIGTTGTAIGTGQANTNDIIAQAGPPSNPLIPYAAFVCADYTSPSGYDDWFLPSLDELNLMYTNLHLSGLGDFDPLDYWSSSEDNAEEAWAVKFSNGLTPTPGKGNSFQFRVRPIRAFSASAEPSAEPEPEPVWGRTMPMTCWQVWINEDNDFQFIFWALYADNNWVRIYDMEDNLVFETDLSDPNLIVDLPDGFYMVRTSYYNTLLQEFLIGKP